MKSYRIVFERKATVFCRGEILVAAEDMDDADNKAENALMQGDVELIPVPSTLEYDRDSCATIIILKETTQ